MFITILRLSIVCKLLLFNLVHAEVARLTLADTEAIAVQREPGILAAQAKAKSYRDKAISNSAMPDPQIRLGMMNVPANDFNFNQEAMTQKQIGFRQTLPRAGSRKAKRLMLEYESQAFEYIARARKREVLKKVRQAWFELYYWQQAKDIVTQNRQLFSRLVKVTRSLYSVGRQNQQDMVRAELELSRLNDRLLKIDEQVLRYRVDLSQWVGEKISHRILPDQLPQWDAPPALSKLKSILPKHPELAMVNAMVESAGAGLDVANAQYKPSFSLDLSYGLRENDLLGNERDDFISFMVTMDIPLFSSKRQDRQVKAARYILSARQNDREMKLRDMKRQLENSYTNWKQLQFRLELYKETILEQNKTLSKAELQAYQNDTGDFNDVMRAYISEINTQLEFIRLQVNQASALSSIDYFTGIIGTGNEKSEHDYES